jgi:hypothetical protein
LLIFISCLQRNWSEDGEKTLKQASEFLWSQQADDGGWHSETHGIMGDGESLTPFILNALLDVPGDVFIPSGKKVNRALDFVRRSVRSKMSHESVPKILDYPNYAASYSLKVLVRRESEMHASEQPLHSSADSLLVVYLRDYLVDQQFDEHRGIDTSHLGIWRNGIIIRDNWSCGPFTYTSRT